MGAIGLQWPSASSAAIPSIPSRMYRCRALWDTGDGTPEPMDSYALTMRPAHVSLALEVVHFAIGTAIRQVGGHDSDYVGAEIKYGW